MDVIQRSVALLEKVSTPYGFTAAPVAEDNYMRVWSRDATICGLAALTTSNENLHKTFAASLNTLWQHQHEYGFLPSNVDVITGAVSYGGTAGRADTASWAIIGLCLYSLHLNDAAFAKKYTTHVNKAFNVMDAWEFNGKNLMYVPQSADWADEYIQHGYVLYDQLLRVWALRLAAKTFASTQYAERAAQIETSIKSNFWFRDDDAGWYAGNMVQQKKNAPKKFWWLGFNPAQIYPQFDLQANALAILLGLGNEHSNDQVMNYAESLLNEGLEMLPSFWPPVQETDWQMHELKNNFAYRFRNLPGQFHNGGLWPVWNGWFAAAALKAGHPAFASRLTDLLHAGVAKNDFEFNECLDAVTGLPCGVKECAWGAAGVLIAKGYTMLFDNQKIFTS